MEINQLPTDNFYKFVALSGMFVLLSSLYFLFYETENIIIEYIQLNTNIEVYKLKSEELERKVQELKNQELKNQNELSQMSELTLHFEILGSEIERDYKILMVKMLKIGVISLLIIIGSGSGVTATFWGLNKWYKLQKLNDKQLFKK